MSDERIYLGMIAGSSIYLTKHSWACNWYWSFGWVGNRKSHFHFESLIGNEDFKVDKVFSKTWITQEIWWELNELFSQAYSLQKVAKVYKSGAGISNASKIINLIDMEMNSRINSDLEKLLDVIWKYLLESKLQIELIEG